MNASELVKLIHRLHLPVQKAERLDFYQTLQAYLVESDHERASVMQNQLRRFDFNLLLFGLNGFS